MSEGGDNYSDLIIIHSYISYWGSALKTWKSESKEAVIRSIQVCLLGKGQGEKSDVDLKAQIEET